MKTLKITTVFIAMMTLAACEHQTLKNVAAEELPPDEPQMFAEKIIGTWEMSTFQSGVDTSATSLTNARPMTKEIGTITFNDDGTFTVAGYVDDGDASVPFYGLFHTLTDYLDPETIHFEYAIEYDSVLCLRYYGTTQVTNQFELKDFALLLVSSDEQTLSFSYGSYPPYVLTKI